MFICVIQKATACHIPCAHVCADMPDDEQTKLYNTLRKTEPDVTNGRQPFMCIFTARSTLMTLWPILLDCIVTLGAAGDKLGINEFIKTCNSQVSKHRGVKAILHLVDGAENNMQRSIQAAGSHVRVISAVEGHRALSDCSTLWMLGGLGSGWVTSEGSFSRALKLTVLQASFIKWTQLTDRSRFGQHMETYTHDSTANILQADN